MHRPTHYLDPMGFLQRQLLRKQTINRLLVIHLILSTPWIMLAFAFHGIFAIIAYMWLLLGWGALRHANRLAWKRHFRPRPKKTAVDA